MPDPRLERLLGGTALAVVRRRLRRHFERGGAAEGVLPIDGLAPDGHEALALLAGRPARSSRSLRLDLAALETRLQTAGVAVSLRDALERLDGAIPDVAGERAALQAAWSALRDRPGREIRLQAWLRSAAATGLLKRLARRDAAVAEAFLAQAATVLTCLPAAGLPRAQLAARTLGDAHALDGGRAVATLVLAAWRHAETASDEEAPEVVDDTPGDLPAADERARDTWARAGVLVNELARPALALNLPPPTDVAAAPCGPGEPAYLSLRWLLRASPSWPVAGLAVFVCENPNVVAIAADRLGTRCAPLVCTDGMPAAAQRTLLQQLAAAGARLRYHGDFDWPGLRIANHVLRSTGAAPWRMGVADYEAATRTAARHALSGVATEAAWDAGLAPAMRRENQAIAEESVTDTLLEDLTN